MDTKDLKHLLVLDIPTFDLYPFITIFDLYANATEVLYRGSIWGSDCLRKRNGEGMPFTSCDHFSGDEGGKRFEKEIFGVERIIFLLFGWGLREVHLGLIRVR